MRLLSLFFAATPVCIAFTSFYSPTQRHFGIKLRGTSWKGDTCPYAVLNVTRKATPEEIKASYWKLAKIHHPDSAPREDSENFQLISDAYSLLHDKGTRSTYDQGKKLCRFSKAAAPVVAAAVELIFHSLSRTRRRKLRAKDEIEPKTKGAEAGGPGKDILARGPGFWGGLRNRLADESVAKAKAASHLSAVDASAKAAAASLDAAAASAEHIDASLSAAAAAIAAAGTGSKVGSGENHKLTVERIRRAAKAGKAGAAAVGGRARSSSKKESILATRTPEKQRKKVSTTGPSRQRKGSTVAAKATVAKGRKREMAAN